MPFKAIAWITAVSGALLGLRFLFAGVSVLIEWGITATDGGLVMCRRLGALYLGLAAIFFFARDAAPSDVRSALCLGTGGAIALLAVLGFVELQSGRATSGILRAALVEAVLAAGFGWAWWSGRVR